jgi:hypothetical protein
VGEWHDAIQHGRQGAKPSDTSIRTGDTGSDESGSRLINSDLNVLALNVRGIMCHGRSEQVRLLMIKHKVSVAILSETETTHSYSATTHMEGFRALCPPTTVTGPPGKEVGVIMMVSADIASSSIQRPDINGSDTVQTVWTEITHLGLIVGGVYRRNRPSQPDLEREEMAQLTNQILKAAQTGKAVLLLGDLNLDHSNPDHKKKNEANDLLCAIEAATMRHLPTGTTWKSDGCHKVCKCVTLCDCPKRQRTATIDNAYLSNSESASAVVLEDALSDHFPIMIRLDINKNAKMTSKLKTIFRRDIARMVTSEFEDALQEHKWSSLYDMSDPNEAVSLIVSNVEAALDKVAPLIPITFRPDKPKLSLRQDTLDAMSLRDAARKSGNRSNFKALRNKVTRLVKRDKINSVLTRLKKNPGPKSAWKEAKTILGRGRGANLPSCTNNDNPADTADHQNQFFIEKVAGLVASLNPSNDGASEKNPVNNEHPTDSFSFKFVTAGDITRIIKDLKNTKAEGVDNIPTDVWKKGVVVLAGPIAKLCNISLSTGVFPDLFKQALVHPVHKGSGKDHREPGSYRPISILPALSKILEIVVRDALYEYLDLRGVLPDSQFGFRPGRSVAMALACAQADWAAAKARGEVVGVMAFDLSAAFDTIDAVHLIEKLKSAGVGGTPLKWFKSYMSGRSQSVIWNGTKSGSRPLTHGVAQGSILGPLLFLVMVADLPKYVTSGTLKAKMMCYADDSTLYLSAESKESLKSNLELMSKKMIEYCNDNGLVINSAKTKLLLSSKDNFEMFVGDSIVHADSEISLLGIDYNTNFSTSPYLQKLATAAKSRAGMIYRLSFGVPSNLLRLLANGLVIGKILAAAPAAIPFKIAYDDRAANLATENINRSIKSVARTITKTALSDKVSSKLVLEKAGLRTLNEMVASQTALMVWKSNKARDPLGRNLFPERSIMRPTRSINCVKATQPVPGNNTLAANLMARAWNSSSELQTATTIGAARSVARKWAQNLLLGT